MADQFFEAIQKRRTYYALKKESPISDARIKEIVETTVKHTPSAYNVQSARAVVLVKEEHDKLWDISADVISNSIPNEEVKQALLGRSKGFKGAYGTVLWFEEQEDLKALGQKHQSIQAIIPEWSDHSSGMHHFVAWTALELEGLGCNLQHQNSNPKFTEAVLKQWNLPSTWVLKSQLVFGAIAAPTYERTYKPLDERVKVFGA